MRKGQWIIFLLVVFGLLGAGNVSAATYYVKPDGNDNADGRSDATAWKTIAKVNSFSFQPGDDVYFKCGGTWNERLYIDWGGVDENNRAIIGAYYLDGGKEKIGVSGSKPTIDGQDKIPSDRYSALVHSKDYNSHVTVQDLRIINSEGLGVNAGRYSTNFNVLRVDTENTLMSGVHYSRANGGLVEGCIIKNAARVYYEGQASDWPAAISIMTRSHGVTVKNNYVVNNHGEGIGLYQGVYKITVEYNTVVNNKNVNIYLDAADNCTIRHNLIYRESSWIYPTTGIWLNDEGLTPSFDPGTGPNRNNKVYGNFIANCNYGLWFNANASNATPIDAYNNRLYNNTIVACREYGIYVRANGGQFTNSAVKNNIVWCGTPGDTAVCSPGYVYGGAPGLTFGYNYWSMSPSSLMMSSSDPGYPSYENGSPKLRKAEGWQDIDANSNLNYSDFDLMDGSRAIDKGENLGEDYKYLLLSGKCHFSMDQPASSNFILSDQNAHGTGWEIGASVFLPSASGLEPPKNLRLVD